MNTQNQIMKMKMIRYSFYEQTDSKRNFAT